MHGFNIYKIKLKFEMRIKIAGRYIYMYINTKLMMKCFVSRQLSNNNTLLNKLSR